MTGEISSAISVFELLLFSKLIGVSLLLNDLELGVLFGSSSSIKFKIHSNWPIFELSTDLRSNSFLCFSVNMSLKSELDCISLDILDMSKLSNDISRLSDWKIKESIEHSNKLANWTKTYKLGSMEPFS